MRPLTTQIDVDALLVEEFRKLLDAEHEEQVYQSFMEQHTKLIPREFIQNHGIHFDIVLRKLAFGSDYKSDFFYLSKSSDDWNCVIIEIENPNHGFSRIAVSCTVIFNKRLTKSIVGEHGWIINRIEMGF
jgi:hypothetical protein